MRSIARDTFIGLSKSVCLSGRYFRFQDSRFLSFLRAKRRYGLSGFGPADAKGPAEYAEIVYETLE